VTISLH